MSICSNFKSSQTCCKKVTGTKHSELISSSLSVVQCWWKSLVITFWDVSGETRAGHAHDHQVLRLSCKCAIIWMGHHRNYECRWQYISTCTPMYVSFLSRSLVSTNDHLLRELDETRQRHQHEVHQMHWSYDNLKKTIDWLPNSTK